VVSIAARAGQVFSAGNDGLVHRWDVTLPRRHMVDLPNEPGSAAIAPQGNSVAVGFADGALRLYSLPDARLLSEAEKSAHKQITTTRVYCGRRLTGNSWFRQHGEAVAGQ